MLGDKVYGQRGLSLMTTPLSETLMGAYALDLGSDGRERFKQRVRSEGHIPSVVSGNRVNRGAKLDGAGIVGAGIRGLSGGKGLWVFRTNGVAGD